MSRLDDKNSPNGSLPDGHLPDARLPDGHLSNGNDVHISSEGFQSPVLPRMVSDTKSDLNRALGQRKIDAVSDEYRKALDDFLSKFVATDAYSQRVIGTAGVGQADKADQVGQIDQADQSNQADHGVFTLPLLREVYERTGVDLMKEAFYKYWKENGKLPEFYASEKSATFDLSCMYSDDLRLHSKADVTLGEYIDDWRDFPANALTDDQKFWCEVAESIRDGLSSDVEAKLVDQFSEIVAKLPEKPDLISLIPSSDPSKSFDNYQMYPLAAKVAEKTSLGVPQQIVSRTSKADRVEKFQGSDKYFGRRSLADGALVADFAKVKGKTILLFDDGLSSGATLDAVRKELYEKGAKKVLSMHLVRC